MENQFIHSTPEQYGSLMNCNQPSSRMVALLFLEPFLTLLHSTGDYVILAETSRTWKQIKTDHCMPNYMTQNLPWSLNEVLCDLETANVTVLNLPNHHPQALTSNIDTIPDSMAFKVMQSRPEHCPIITSPSQHHQNLPPPATFNKNNKCNQHPNPWHITEQCPVKDPSLIQNKLIRNNVMQHDTLSCRTNNKFLNKSTSPSNKH